MARIRKIVLIGSEGYEFANPDVCVNCFSWHKIGNILNIRDYDMVIINLLSLADEKRRREIEWDTVDSILNASNVLEVLYHGGAIIVVGDPRFTIPRVQTVEMSGKKNYKYTPFLQWTGLKFYWDNVPGDTIHFKKDYQHRHFEEYIKKFHKWDYSLANVKLDAEVIKKVFNLRVMAQKNLSLDIKSDYFCWNRYKNGLAVTLRLRIVAPGVAFDIKETRHEYGPIIILPKIDASEDETLMIILCDICGVESSLPEPEWLVDYIAPGQDETDEEIHKITSNIEEKWISLQEAKKLREHVRACLKLLYEREKALEPIVRDILRGLGAQVEDPIEPNKEDCWITVEANGKTYEGVLEIKSTKNTQFNEYGIRQLLDWIDRGVRLRKKKFKGIFIGNSAINIPPKERPWPFNSNWEKSAELHGMCALRTVDIYSIHLQNVSGKFNRDEFWQKVFETNGIFKLEE